MNKDSFDHILNLPLMIWLSTPSRLSMASGLLQSFSSVSKMLFIFSPALSVTSIILGVPPMTSSGMLSDAASGAMAASEVIFMRFLRTSSDSVSVRRAGTARPQTRNRFSTMLHPHFRSTESEGKNVIQTFGST
jgi:hypothetical protein